MLNCNNTYKEIPKNILIIHYIDVGQGDSELIQFNNKNILIDSGPKDSRKHLKHYLESLGIKHFDYVIATHPHEDHIDNMDYIISNYKVNKFLSPKSITNTPSFISMINSLKNKKLKINVLYNGYDKINIDDKITVQVLSPEKVKYDNMNNYSAVIKLTYGKTSFLFTGDSEKQIEDNLLQKNCNIKADVLKVAHHGSSTSTSENYLKKVNPRIAIISVGLNNTYKHPSSKTINTLNKYNIKTFRTDKNGTIILQSDGNTIKKVL